jgi:hypothetical protein
MNIQERREYVLSILRRRNRYQFGQPPATCDLVTRSGCADTCIQLIVWMAKGKKVSLNMVRRRSGAPPSSPMQIDQALRALHSFGLPYELRTGLKAGEVIRIAERYGPVIVAERYWAHPQWENYVYAGKRLLGWAKNDSGKRVRVGLARPLQRAGLTQWTFRDGHAVLAATGMYLDGKRFGVIRDPNHNSPARPERPAYDLVTMFQLNRMLASWPGTSVALVPTRVVIK